MTDAIRAETNERLSRVTSRLPLVQLLFVRHARAPFLQGEALKRGPASDEDAKRDLHDEGRRQCEDAGTRFFGKLDNVSFILHSTAVRCKTTARLVFVEQCCSRLGSAPVMPVQRLYPGSGAKFKASSPDFAQATARAEAAFQLLGHVPLKRYYADPEVKAAFKVYALHVLHELLGTIETRLIADQDERFACQVVVFAHGVYLQAVALLAAQLLLQPDAEKDKILSATVDELDVIQVERRHSKHARTLA